MDEFARIRKMAAQLTVNEKSATYKNRHYRSNDRDSEVVVGIGDDAAVVSWPTEDELVVSCDTFVETVHFNRWTMTDEAIGYKAIAANVSDIAAMGAIPLYALISISTPKRYSMKRIERIYRGINRCALTYGIKIIGGDTVHSPRHLVITVTMFGKVERSKAILRSGAKPGDAVFVTGYPGLASAGLQALLDEKKCYPKASEMIEPFRTLVNAHQRPQPSVEAGRLLVQSGVCHALNDLSDGLASEAYEISEASGYTLVLYESSIPIAKPLSAYADLYASQHPLDWILYGGEDFHLIGTIAPQGVDKVREQFAAKGLPFFIIGQVSDERTNDGAVKWVGEHGITTLGKKGYNHFSQ